MIRTVSKFTFIDLFKSSDTYKNNFSYEGLDALFDYLEQLEDDIGEQIEFDPIAICCDFSEYDSFEEIKEEYDCIDTEDDLYDHTQVIPLDSGGYIIQDF